MSSMNFTCDVCGREVFSCAFVNGMKFCAKCYQETFGETDKDRKISDLEAKLAESEKKAYSRGHSQRDIANEIKLNALREDVANKEKRIVELKQQLEKSEKSKESYRLQNEQYHLQLLQFYSRLGVEAFGADIHEKALETLMIMKEQLAEKDKQIAELKKQLEEKEKDNQFLKKMYLSERTKNDNYHTEKYGLDKPVEELRKIKLTPKEKEIYYKGFDNCERQFATHIVELQQQLAEKEEQLKEELVEKKGLERALSACNRQNDEFADIQKQLAENEKEISEYVKIVDDLHKQLSDKCDFCDKTKDQDKISFALEQLEKVKELCKTKFEWWENSEWEGNIYDKSDVSNAYFDIEANIDQQIASLKKGVQ